MNDHRDPQYTTNIVRLPLGNPHSSPLHRSPILITVSQPPSRSTWQPRFTNFRKRQDDRCSILLASRSLHGGLSRTGSAAGHLGVALSPEDGPCLGPGEGLSTSRMGSRRSNDGRSYSRRLDAITRVPTRMAPSPHIQPRNSSPSCCQSSKMMA